MTPTHIDLIRAGDTILHNGKIMTVCHKDLTRIEGMGCAVFGDTYRLGYLPVQRIEGLRT